MEKSEQFRVTRIRSILMSPKTYSPSAPDELFMGESYMFSLDKSIYCIHVSFLNAGRLDIFHRAHSPSTWL